MSNKILHTTDATFGQDVLQASKPVLLDFWAEWCGPCKMLAPLLDELAESHGDRLQVVKMDVDKNKTVPDQFGVRGIPTMVLFKNGKVVGQKVGAMAKGQLLAFIETHL